VIDEGVVFQLPNVRFVLRPYVGYDDIDVDALTYGLTNARPKKCGSSSPCGGGRPAARSAATAGKSTSTSLVNRKPAVRKASRYSPRVRW
jgi:hypothetical protein